eukprot:Platyproteum_vivax@DN1097_c0_g1_i1.p1
MRTSFSMKGVGNQCWSNNGDCPFRSECLWNAKKQEVTCKCHEGYGGDDCDEVAVCADVQCPKHSTCVDVVNEPVCVCKNGYARSGKICLDIDECSVNNGGCDPAATCTNQPGASPLCACPQGYEEATPLVTSNLCVETAQKCRDIDECLVEDVCRNGGKCINTEGSYVCRCGIGYFQDPKTRRCTDLDECALNLHSCSPLAECTNTPGSYECECSVGFEGDGRSCKAAGGCSEQCPDGQVCTGPAGGNRCVPVVAGADSVCPQLTSFDGKLREASPCETTTVGCAVEASCSWQDGTAECTCLPGFEETVSRKNKDGHVCNEASQECRDQGECQHMNGGCDPLAQCLEQAGAPPICICPPKHTGNGLVCCSEDEVFTGLVCCPSDGWEVGDDGLCFHQDELLICPPGTVPDVQNGYCTNQEEPEPDITFEPPPELEGDGWMPPAVDPSSPVDPPGFTPPDYIAPEYTPPLVPAVPVGPPLGLQGPQVPPPVVPTPIKVCPDKFVFALGQCVPIYSQPTSTAKQPPSCATHKCVAPLGCVESLFGPRCAFMPRAGGGGKIKGVRLSGHKEAYMPKWHPPVIFKLSWEAKGTRKWFFDCGHDVSLAGFGRGRKWFSVLHFLLPGRVYGGVTAHAPEEVRLARNEREWKPYKLHCNVYPPSSPYACDKQDSVPLPGSLLRQAGNTKSTQDSKMVVFRTNNVESFKQNPCDQGYFYSPAVALCLPN